MRLGMRMITIAAVAALSVPLLMGQDTPATAPPASAPPVPRVELFLGYSGAWAVPTDNLNNRVVSLNGVTESLAWNLNRFVGLVGEGSAYRDTKLRLTGSGANPPRTADSKGMVYTFLAGPRVSMRSSSPFTPFVQALFGEEQASAVTLNGCAGVGCTPLPGEKTFAMTAGGGLDLRLTPTLSLRLFQVEDKLTRYADLATGMRSGQNDVRLSAGFVFGFGNLTPPAPVAVNHPPVVACAAAPSMVYAGSGDQVAIRAQASDPDNDLLSYAWTASQGNIDGSGPEVQWNSTGLEPGSYAVDLTVNDGRGGSAECSTAVQVQARPNRAPIMSCAVDPSSVIAGQAARITATAQDPDGDPLTYTWTPSGGQIVDTGASVQLDTAGLTPGDYTVAGQVADGRGGTADCSVAVAVAAAPPPPIVHQLEQKLALHSIYFQTNQPTGAAAGLVASQREVVETLAEDFKTYLGYSPDAHLTLQGHADRRGTVAYNRALGERRVERIRQILVQNGIPAASIEIRSFGKDDNLDAAQVRQMIETNPDLTPEERQAILKNLPALILAANRRVDVVLSTTGQTSVRQYPFNAKDYLALIKTAQTSTK